jgi:glucose/arabinose dehydrogenase
LIRNLVGLAVIALAFPACSSESDTCCTPYPSDLTVELEPFVVSGLTSPVFMTQPLNDARIFVVEQPGRIRVIRNGALQATPFLDIQDRVLDGGERGLLSVAFHPQYATNRFFYVYYTGANGEIRVERYTTTANAEVADPATAQLIISAAHSQFGNHNGGQVAFGPDGMLWMALGDGGGGGDPLGSGQNFNTLLGSMLRINVNSGDPYTIPDTNPYRSVTGVRPEVWAKGLRNPWRFSFDAQTGLLYIADVGQDEREEVNANQYAVGGANYGWNVMEGTTCYTSSPCNETGYYTLPVLDYVNDADCAVTGGYVYRGSEIDGLQGHYLYSDYCGGWLKSFRYSAGVAVDRRDWGITRVGSVPSFGVDYAGEVYMIAGSGIYKIVAGE